MDTLNMIFVGIPVIVAGALPIAAIVTLIWCVVKIKQLEKKIK
ncbi:MAG TPA: hypothetical protein VJ841_03490 [Candidatus Saccharimonadales bacterium]|nr:hypothetical protein [Candidatus Saccharimonadales bacterium]